MKDIADWASDWSPALDVAKSVSKVMFIHGDLHTFHRVEDISAICAAQASIGSLIIEGSAQLALYEQPLAIGQGIQSLLGVESG